MPSPSFDPWFASRRFGIVIDAGSSGSRLQIYSWLDNSNHPANSQQPILPVVEKGSKDPDNWVVKIEPGISSFAASPDKISHHLAPLLEHARNYIPPSLHSETPLFLYATAGMRLLPAKDQTAVLKAACDFLRFHSEFRVSDDDDDNNNNNNHESDNVLPPRACKNHVRVISGEEEGLFGWIAVNYLMDAFTSNSNPSLSYGFLDMGGASAQIAFKVDPNSSSISNSLPLMPVTLNLLNGESIHHDVFVTTWLGYGTNQAREKYVARMAQAHATPGDQNSDAIPDPCLPSGLSMPVYDVGTRQNPIIIEEDDFEENEAESDLHSKEPSLYLRGTGSFDECVSMSAELLLNVDTSNDNDSPQNPPLPLPFPLPLETTPFVGISEYWYTSEHLFGLGGVYDDAAFEDAAKKFCAVGWKNMEFLYLGRGEGDGDGDLDLSDSSWAGPHSKYASKIDAHRLEMQCFKSAWMMNVLHLGLGMPKSRIVEVEREDNREDIVFVGIAGEEDDGATPPHLNEKFKSVMTKPMFQSVDTIRDTSISWTLGKMVLEASRQVGRNLKSDNRQKQKPKVPPLVDTIPADSTPIRHLPPHISSPSTSVSSSSPFILCLYAVAIVVLFLISYRVGVWYQVKVVLRRWWRKGSGQAVLNGIGKLGRYGDDSQNGGLDENGAEQLEMGGAPETGKQSRFLSVLLSVRKGIFPKIVHPMKTRSSELYPMNRQTSTNGYNHNGQPPDAYHRLETESTSIFEINPDSEAYYHSKMNSSARAMHRSASLPLSLSSPQSQPQSHSQTQALQPSSSSSSSYSNSPASLATYTSLSPSPFPVASTPTANGIGTALTTALTTQPLNHFAQSRSRNSSQVNLASPNFGGSTGASNLGAGLRAGATGTGLQARSANSSQASLVSLKKRAYEYAAASS